PMLRERSGGFRHLKRIGITSSSSSGGIMLKGRSIAAAAGLLAAFLAPPARAAGTEDASPTAKGIVGGALLGGEAVMLVEAALDVKPAWAYIVGGLAGGVGGGVGGYFVEQGDPPESARISML